MVVVIPCYNEPQLAPTLNALHACTKPNCAVEVIVVVNSSESAHQKVREQNAKTRAFFRAFAEENNTDRLSFLMIDAPNLPQKHAGVGLARKIGMDEAVHRFEHLNKDGIIVCFDADATCLPNYLTAIAHHFEKHKKTPGCSIHFEHPIHGQDYPLSIYTGITNYELHLRYYNCALKFANLPYAYHTVGSSMAVRSSAYQKQGGMNKRKAGEDFYFIHKIIALGNFTELKNTAVIPSPRISDRVPFGTGKAIGDWIAEGASTYQTYAFDSFILIKKITKIIPELRTKEFIEFKHEFLAQEWELLTQFLHSNKFDKSLKEIRANAKTAAAFDKRFYVWLDAFRILKLVHFLRDNGFKNKSLLSQCNRLLVATNEKEQKTVRHQLLLLRTIEKKTF